MTRKILLSFALSFAAACSHATPAAENETTPSASSETSSTTTIESPSTPAGNGGSSERLVGGGPDEHGCYPDGGYRWCEHEHACVRSWELAAQRGFERTAEAFERYCSTP